MGGAFSSAVGGPVTRQQLLDATKNNRDFVQKLFQALTTQLTQEDLLKLGDQRMCNKYVFLMADTIQKLFEQLKIKPSREKSTGILYFQKVEKLTERTAESKTYCLEIAYYYIRIFQIFGALALSILDDPAAGITLSEAGYVEPPARAEFGFGRRPSVPGLKYAMLGGADPSTMDKGARAWRLISNDLEEKEMISLGGHPFDVFPFSANRDLMLIPDLPKNLRYKKDSERLSAKGSISLVKSTFPQQIRILLTGWELTKTSKTEQVTINNKIGKVEKYVLAARPNDTSDWTIGSAGTSLSDAIVSKFDELLQLCDEIEADPRKVIPSLIPTRALKPVAGAPTAPLYGVAAGETAQRQLQTKYILDTMRQLAGQKTTSFCVARALQLLNAPTLFSPRSATTARSGVCLTSFDKLPLSVPVAGTPISRIPGLRAVDQLFHDAPHLDPRDGTAIDVSDPVQYQEMLKLFATAFTGKIPTKLTGMDSILAKTPDCATAAAKHYLKLTDPKAIKEVVAIVHKMFGRQLAHTRRVMEFLTKKLLILYKEGGGTKVSLHPNILKGGLAEVNKLSAEARTILIDYYKGCEDLYQEGLQKVLASRGLEVQP